MVKTRTETDSLGDVEVPRDALYGAQTQRAVDNFPISGQSMPASFLRALAQIKRCAALVNTELGVISPGIGEAIADAAREILTGDFSSQFPVDVFQTGSGTSSNMNMNEVLGRLATLRSGLSIHPNDHVNCCQSSNDVVPACIQLAAAVEVSQSLVPALQTLESSIRRRADALGGLAKTGRTHLMDAMPLRIDQEMDAWAAQVKDGAARVSCMQAQLLHLPLGGTAVGTGVNAHPEFAERVTRRLSKELALPVTAQTGFRDLGRQDLAVDLSGRLNSTASSLMKIANDLRWMNSGPLAGLGEVQLPALQPGSSIMPGKVNPVLAEALAMVCAQVSGNHVAITIAGSSGNFQLNVMLPLIARNLLESIKLLANGSRLLAEKVIDGLTVDKQRLAESLARNPVLVTALNQRIGYAAASAIAKRSIEEQRSVLAIVLEDTDIPETELRVLLDPLRLTEGGIP